MPITKLYTPYTHEVKTNRMYTFQFPAIEARDIEVYEIIQVDGVDYRYLVPVQDYYIEWQTSRPKYAVKDSGRVVFTRRHSSGTHTVRVERNTLIDQTAVMPEHANYFNGRVVGVMWDKATMIAQEIAERKCDVTTTTAITQLAEITAYDDYRAEMFNQIMDKLYDILQEIRDSGEDCKGREDET